MRLVLRRDYYTGNKGYPGNPGKENKKIFTPISDPACGATLPHYAVCVYPALGLTLSHYVPDYLKPKSCDFRKSLVISESSIEVSNGMGVTYWKFPLIWELQIAISNGMGVANCKFPAPMGVTCVGGGVTSNLYCRRCSWR